MLVKATKLGSYEDKHLKKVRGWLKKAQKESLVVNLGSGNGPLNNAFLAITTRLTFGAVKFDVFAHGSSVYQVTEGEEVGDGKASSTLSYLGAADGLQWLPAKHSIVATLKAELDGIELEANATVKFRRTVRFEVHTSGGVQYQARTALKVYTNKNGRAKVRYYVDNLGLVARSDIDFYAFLGAKSGECLTEWVLEETEVVSSKRSASDSDND